MIVNGHSIVFFLKFGENVVNLTLSEMKLNNKLLLTSPNLNFFFLNDHLMLIYGTQF
jgi:hypothetical protein